MIGPSGLFPGEESLLHQFGDTALGIAPVQSQGCRQFRLGAARVLPHVNHGEQRAEAQPQLLEPLGGIGGETAVKHGGIIGQGLKHELFSTFS